MANRVNLDLGHCDRHRGGWRLGGQYMGVNEGMRDAHSVVLGVYGQEAISGTMPLVWSTVTVPAGEHRVVNLKLGNYRYRCFLFT